MADEDTSSMSNFTAGETKLIMSMIKRMQGDFPTDFVGVAADMGYKDASIAKTRWSQIKKKKITGSAPAGGVDKTPPNKKTPAKAKKATVAGEGVEGDTPKTPAKRGRKPKSAPKIKAEESGEAEVGDAGSDADVAGDGAETAGEEVKAGA